MANLEDVTRKIPYPFTGARLLSGDKFATVPEDGYIDAVELITAIVDLLQPQITANANAIIDNENDILVNISDIQDNTDDIAINISDIQDNADDIVLAEGRLDTLEDRQTVIQEVTDRLIGTDPAPQNNSSVTRVDSGLLATITPKSASSKLMVKSVTMWGNDVAGQSGCKAVIEYKVGTGAWTDLLTPGQGGSGYFRDSTGISSATQRHQIVTMQELASPGILNAIQFRLRFLSVEPTIYIIGKPSLGDFYIKVQEILT